MKRRYTPVFFVLLFLLRYSAAAQPYFAVRINKLWGLIDSTGAIKLEPAYDKIFVYGVRDDYPVAYKGDSVYLFNSQLRRVAATNYGHIVGIGEGMFMTRSKTDYLKSFYGLMDSTGKVIFEPQFNHIEHFSEGLALVNFYPDTAQRIKETEHSGIMDKKGNWIIPPAYKKGRLESCKEGLIVFCTDHRWGAMNAAGKVVIEAKYTGLGQCRNGYMEFSKPEGEHGLMKKDETVVLLLKEDEVISYNPVIPSDTLVAVDKRKPLKNDILPYRYVSCSIYTVHGVFLFKSPYTDCSSEGNGFFRIMDGKGGVGLLDAKGKMVLKPSYDFIQWFEKGMKQAAKEGKQGFINEEGREVIPCMYIDTEPFSNGLARIYTGGDSGDFIFPDKHPEIKMGYINRAGKIIWEPSW